MNKRALLARRLLLVSSRIYIQMDPRNQCVGFAAAQGTSAGTAETALTDGLCLTVCIK